MNTVALYCKPFVSGTSFKTAENKSKSHDCLQQQMTVATNWKGREGNRSWRHLSYIPGILWMRRVKKENNRVPTSIKIGLLENTSQKHNGLSQLHEKRYSKYCLKEI